MAGTVLRRRPARAIRPLDARRIPLALIDLPAVTLRLDRDGRDLEKLAKSIGRPGIGQLQLVIVRPKGRRFELVVGERRYHALQRNGARTIDATVRKLTNREAAEIRVLENLDRRNLNPIEEAAALRMLKVVGHDSKSLARLLRTEVSAVDARLSLLGLPKEWQSHVEAGRVSAVQAEYLVPWAKRAQILHAMAKLVRNGWKYPLSEWRHRIVLAAFAISRSMDAHAVDGPRFKLTRDRIGRLDIMDVTVEPGKSVRRAFATGLWDEWQDQADFGDLGRDTQSAAGGRNGRQAALHRYGDRIVADSDEEQFQRRLADWKANYLRVLCRDVVDNADPSALPGLASALGIDFDRVWKLRRDFLELFEGKRLVQLAKELSVDVTVCRNDSERVAVLLAAAPRTVPNAFLNAGAISDGDC
jgi:ParB/RepB/Spo0J family partition protein